MGSPTFTVLSCEPFAVNVGSFAPRGATGGAGTVGVGATAGDVAPLVCKDWMICVIVASKPDTLAIAPCETPLGFASEALILSSEDWSAASRVCVATLGVVAPAVELVVPFVCACVWAAVEAR